ncbi:MULTISPECIES: acyltransferase family protein [unclassified Levilactobacillus]|uniref:acyltransferase family protein n=1 Tax=unclassified Levilactobacillus TaxID=2767918 RepID=UPI002FF19C49
MIGGHCGMLFTHFIYLFHMAIFFMASGYCFNASNSETMQDVLSFVKRKFKGLWFPYVLWTAVFSLLHNVFIKTGIYSPDPWSISEIEKNIIKSFFLHGHTQLGSALWFISTLMQIAAASKKANFLLQGAVSIVFLAVGYRCGLTNSIGGVNRVLSYYCLFYLGAVVRELQKTVRTEKYHYWKMVVAFLILVLCNQIGSIALDENRYENPVFLLVVSICGWVLLYEVAQELKKKKLLADAIVCCGQNSMAIVVLHFLCFKIISLVGVVVYNQPREGIAAFPVLYEQGAWWIAYMFAGIIVPVFLSVMWKKLKGKQEKRYSVVK